VPQWPDMMLRPWLYSDQLPTSSVAATSRKARQPPREHKGSRSMRYVVTLSRDKDEDAMVRPTAAAAIASIEKAVARGWRVKRITRDGEKIDGDSLRQDAGLAPEAQAGTGE
jgi:hypothetical protein